MTLPKPEPGLVISYNYLWRYQREVGEEEGLKTRPCVIILAIEKHDGELLVTVAPMTHTAPSHSDEAVKIPLSVKRHLGLDSVDSWVVIAELNQFIWPGYDVRFIAGDHARKAYGFLPRALFDQIKKAAVERYKKQRLLITKRD